MNKKNPFNIPLSAVSPKNIGDGKGAYPVIFADCVGGGVNGSIGHIRFQSGPYSGTGRYMNYDLALRMSEYACIAINNHERLVEENKRLREVVLYLARSRQHSEVDSHYRLEALVSLATRTLSESDGENDRSHENAIL